jgi:hypothetical protein
MDSRDAQALPPAGDGLSPVRHHAGQDQRGRHEPGAAQPCQNKARPLPLSAFISGRTMSAMYPNQVTPMKRFTTSQENRLSEPAHHSRSGLHGSFCDHRIPPSACLRMHFWSMNRQLSIQSTGLPGRRARRVWSLPLALCSSLPEPVVVAHKPAPPRPAQQRRCTHERHYSRRAVEQVFHS